jgi:hypothetical protein
MIRQLENPLTETYLEFKQMCLGKDIPWFWHKEHIENLSESDYDPTERSNFGFYGFAILQRKESRVKVPTSELGTGKLIEIYLRKAVRTFSEITRHNGIEYSTIHRISVNATHPVPPPNLGIEHVDHEFPHKNMILYFTDVDNGPTICEGESFYGKEDDVIVLEGMHCLRAPETKRRIIVVYTFTQTN